MAEPLEPACGSAGVVCRGLEADVDTSWGEGRENLQEVAMPGRTMVLLATVGQSAGSWLDLVVSSGWSGR